MIYVDKNIKQAIFLTIIIACGIIIVASLWNIDFVMWYKSAYWYYPFPGYWNRPVYKNELGLFVNIQYYQIAICFITGVITAYKLGESEK